MVYELFEPPKNDLMAINQEEADGHVRRWNWNG